MSTAIIPAQTLACLGALGLIIGLFSLLRSLNAYVLACRGRGGGNSYLPLAQLQSKLPPWLHWIRDLDAQALGQAPVSGRSEVINAMEKELHSLPGLAWLVQIGSLGPLGGVVATSVGFLLEMRHASSNHVVWSVSSIAPLFYGICAGAGISIASHVFVRFGEGRLHATARHLAAWFDSQVWPAWHSLSGAEVKSALASIGRLGREAGRLTGIISQSASDLKTSMSDAVANVHLLTQFTHSVALNVRSQSDENAALAQHVRESAGESLALTNWFRDDLRPALHEMKTAVCASTAALTAWMDNLPRQQQSVQQLEQGGLQLSNLVTKSLVPSILGFTQMLPEAVRSMQRILDFNAFCDALTRQLQDARLGMDNSIASTQAQLGILAELAGELRGFSEGAAKEINSSVRLLALASQKAVAIGDLLSAPAERMASATAGLGESAASLAHSSMLLGTSAESISASTGDLRSLFADLLEERVAVGPNPVTPPPVQGSGNISPPAT